ncbi:MAG: hypothetical protein LBC70_10710 [Chitinispirillales bacterium]|jgi:hypothetical protein|nr:hypothetical protein [Chitinispirillales bacterium]
MRARVFERIAGRGIIAVQAAVAVMLAVSVAAAQTAFGGGSGLAGDPYIITTPAQLDAVRNGLTAHYRLGGDIDLTGTSYVGGNNGWTPIGISAVGSQFTGVFDGAGHTIAGLYINRTGYYAGLFGYIGTGGEVKNLGMTGVDITVTGASAYGDYVGGLAGASAGTIDNCYVTGKVSGAHNNVGGLVGNNLGGTIRNSYSAANVSGLDHVGGLVGQQNGGKVENCYATGAVTAAGSGAGGLVGWHVTGTGAQIINSAALNSSVSGNTNVGRIVGSLGGATAVLSNNDAWDEMPTLLGGSDKNPLDLGPNRLDGGNVSIQQVVEDPTLGGKIIGGVELPDNFRVVLGNVAVVVIAPGAGVMPHPVAGVSGNFSAGPVSWSPEPAGGIFHNGVEYTCMVTLTADSKYTFDGLISATINGNEAQVTNNTGASVTLSYQFPVTADKITPNVTFPANVTITYGQLLGDDSIELEYSVSTPGGSGMLTFVNPTAMPAVAQSGEFHQMIFTPDNMDDFNVVIREVPVTVNPRAVTIAANAMTKAFGMTDPTLTYTVSMSTPLVGTDVLTGALGRVPGEDLGSYAITQGSLSAGDNYVVTFNGAVFAITRAVLNHIAVTVIAPVTLSQPDRSAGVSGNFSAGEVSWSPEPADGVFHAGVEYTAAVTLTAEYGYTFEGLMGATVNGSIAQITGNTGASVTLSYQFPAAMEKLTPVVDFPTAAALTYGQWLGDAWLTGGGSTTPGTLTFATPRAQPAVAQSGEYFQMIFTPYNTDDYTVITADVPVTVSPRPVTITAISLTKVFGEAEPVLTYVISASTPLVGIDVLTGTLERDLGEDVGSYAIRQGSLSAGGNYAITFNDAVFTIAPAVLDDIAVTVVAPSTGNAPSTAAGVSGHFSAGDVLWSPEPEGGEFHFGVEYTATVTLTAELGYVFGGLIDAAINGNEAQVFNNTGASVTLSYQFPAATEKLTPDVDFPTAEPLTYGQWLEDARLTGGASTTPGTFTFATPRAQPGVAQSGQYYQMIFTPNNMDDYGVVIGEVPVTVAPRPLTVTADAKTKVFGAADPAFTYTVSASTPLVGTDVLTGALERDPGEGVGSYAITLGSLNAGDNYVITFNGAVFTIVRLALHDVAVTVVAPGTGNAPNRTAGVSGHFSAGLVSWSPEPEGGVFHYGVEYTATVRLTAETGYTFSGLAGATVNGNAAQIISNIGTSVTLSYKFPATAGRLMPVVNFPTGAALTYGQRLGTAQLTGGGSAVQGEFSFVAPMTMPGVAQSGTRYQMIFTPATNDHSIVTGEVPVTVSPRPLTVTANARNKIFGAADPALTYTVSASTPLVGADVLTGALRRDPGEGAGYYAIRLGSLSAGGNYAITFNDAVFTIMRLALYNVAVVVAAPGTGNAPSRLAGVTGNFSAGEVSWSPEPVDGMFHHGVEYTATVTLTAGAGHTFSGLTAATINGHQAQMTDNTGATVTLSYRFPATAGKIIPVVDFPTGATLIYGQWLGEALFTGGEGSATPGGITFATLRAQPGVAQSGEYFQMIFTPDNMDDYTIVIGEVPVAVSPRPLTVDADAKTKAFGEADPALTYTVSASTPLVGIDVLTGALERDSGENLGDYAIVQGNLSAGDNYELTFNDAVFNIIPAALDDIAITVVAPATLAQPSAVAGVSGNFSAGDVSWSPEPEGGVFHYNEEYTATVTLTADYGYTFDGLTAAAINGNNAQIADNTGASVTLSYQFPATADKRDPVADFPTGAVITYGQRLWEAAVMGGSTTPGVFSFATPMEQPGVAQSGNPFMMIFTPDNMDDYNVVMRGVPVTVRKAPRDKPVFSWIPATITDTSITFRPPENLPAALEYSLIGAVWQDSPYFSGLRPNTRYMFQLRFKETENYFASESVEMEKRTFLTGDPVLVEDDDAAPSVPDNFARTNDSYGITLARGIVTDRADFTVSVPGNRKANVVIFNNVGNVVFSRQGIRNGEAVTWNLTNTGGRGVSSGSYLIVATARDENGKTYRYSARFGVRRR